MVVVSSVKRTKCELQQLGKPLTKSKKRIGPRTEPCGTPCLAGSMSELQPLKLTYCYLFPK